MRMPRVDYEVIPLIGGLDLVTPTLSLKPGVARDALNFEVSVTGGYSRIAGYERFDGRPSPSAAVFAQVTLSALGTIAVGDTITGVTSNATGVVCALNGNVVVYTRATGAFQLGESVSKSSGVQGTVTVAGAAPATALQLATWTAAAANIYRSDIGAVPGSGPVRGVAVLNGALYAWRNNAGGTALQLYRSSATGWVLVSLGSELAVTTVGATAIAEGATVTGAVSGATGVVSRVVLTATAWSAGIPARLMLSTTTGTFQAGESLTVGGVQRATAGGAAAAITLLPSGRVDTVIANFGGAAGTLRIYGVDGVNRGFEFDGTVYVPIVTGMAQDRPTRVAVHKAHLFFSFDASLQHSAPGYPYSWTPVLGAAELALGEVVNDLVSQPGNQQGGALAIFTTNNTFILYGTGVASWNLVPFNLGVGGLRYGAQNLMDTYTFDSRGVTALSTTLNYGNFDSAALTLNIRPWVQARRTLLTDSAVSREKSQYRAFFSDGFGLYVTLVNGRMRGAMPVLFPNPVTAIVSGTTALGNEVSYFGSTNGFVYQLDAGTSFDGLPIPAALTLNFDSMKSPRVLKRFRRGSFEVSGGGYAAFDVAADLGYSTSDIDQLTAQPYTGDLRLTNWDAFIWDAFTWDGVTLAPTEIELEGTAENIAVRVTSSGAIYPQFTLNSLILHYTLRRGLR